MRSCTNTNNTERLILWAETAADLMTPNPVSIGADDTVEEAIAFLTDRGYSAAAVIDGTARPVGVLSHTDIMVHDREMPDRPPAMRRLVVAEELILRSGGLVEDRVRSQDIDGARVRDMMTPAVFSVLSSTPASRVIADMVALKVHQIYVVDDGGALIGVISALDVLRHLGVADPQRPAASTVNAG